MSNFNELIKQKISEFNVPFNEDHWKEMERKLNAKKAAKTKQNIYFAAGLASLIVITSIFIFNKTPNQSKIIKPNLPTANAIVTTKNKQEAKKENHPKVVNVKKKQQQQTSNNPTKTKKEINKSSYTSEESTTPLKESNNTATIISPTKQLKPSAKFITFNNQICLGEEVSFEANEIASSAVYSWNFGDGTTSNKQNPNHIYLAHGKYDVTLTVLEKTSGLKVTHTEKEAVIIFKKPSTDFKFSELSVLHDNNKLKYPKTSFKSKENDIDNTYLWSFGNGETANISNPAIIFKKNGTFNISLTIKNNKGCTNSTSKNIEIKNAFDLFAPNAFTPDGNGNNDNFIPKALLSSNVKFEMIITDLSNKILYKTTDKNEPWKGSQNNNGAILPSGTYLWKVITYDVEGKSHLHIGRIKIIK